MKLDINPIELREIEEEDILELTEVMTLGF